MIKHKFKYKTTEEILYKYTSLPPEIINIIAEYVYYETRPKLLFDFNIFKNWKYYNNNLDSKLISIFINNKVHFYRIYKTDKMLYIWDKYNELFEYKNIYKIQNKTSYDKYVYENNKIIKIDNNNINIRNINLNNFEKLNILFLLQKIFVCNLPIYYIRYARIQLGLFVYSYWYRYLLSQMNLGRDNLIKLYYKLKYTIK